MSARHDSEKQMMQFDRRPKLIGGAIGLAAVIAVVIFMAYVIASGFAAY